MFNDEQRQVTWEFIRVWNPDFYAGRDNIETSDNQLRDAVQAVVDNDWFVIDSFPECNDCTEGVTDYPVTDEGTCSWCGRPKVVDEGYFSETFSEEAKQQIRDSKHE